MTKSIPRAGFLTAGVIAAVISGVVAGPAFGGGPAGPGGPAGGPAGKPPAGPKAVPVTDKSLAELAKPAGLVIGTAVNVDALAEDEKYRAIVEREFNSVTAENVMKWEALEPEPGVYTYEKADELIAWAKEHGKVVRGHTLVWHNQYPSWINEEDYTKEELREILKNHVIETARHFKGKLYEWDVINEAFNEDGSLRDTIWLRALGEDYIADLFRWARQGDPKVKLYYNDYNLEWIGPKSDAAYALMKKLLAEGVPVDGIGFQGHLGGQYGFDTGVYTNFKRFADLGLEISVTEADVRYELPADNYKIQSQVQGYHSLLQPCLLVSACHSFTIWGVSDNYSWVPGVFPGEGNALLWDEDYQPKPAYVGVQLDLALAGSHPAKRPPARP